MRPALMFLRFPAVALLTLVMNATATTPAHVTVGNCHWLDEAEAMRVTAQLDWSVSGADRYGTADIRRAWQVEAVLQLTDAYDSTIVYSVVSPPDEGVAGTYLVQDVYAFDGYTDSATGSGAATEAEIWVEVDSRTCAIYARFYVAGPVDHVSPQGSDTGVAGAANVELFDIVEVEEFLGGTMQLPHITAVDIEESHFFPGWFTTAEVALADANLGMADFTWSIEPLGAP